MRYLGDYSRGRDNNLNLIRMIAAAGVLVSHAWPLTMGSGAVQPLVRVTGHSLGTICVYVFFAISGFLIAASFDRSDTIRFVAARVLRLVPGLFVSVAVVALLMGPMVTTLPVSDYFTNSDVYKFILRNTAMLSPLYTLPGVFETNPYPTVEGSIWTLAHEAICYVGIFLVGVLGVLKRRVLMSAVLLLYAVLWLVVEITEPVLHGRVAELHSLTLPFAVGTALYLWRDRVMLTAPILLGLLTLTVLLRISLPENNTAYHLALIAAIAYSTFWFAHIPNGWIRHYNRFGDYSYGLYIYAFPIQGLLVYLMPGMTPLENIAWSFPATMIASVLSWHFVEKPALALRNRVTTIVGQSHSTLP